MSPKITLKMLTRTKRNKSERLPSLLACVDTETFREQDCVNTNLMRHRFRLGVMWTGRFDKGNVTRERWFNLTSPEQFWEITELLARRRSKLYVFTHNVPFDLEVLGWRNKMLDGTLCYYDPEWKVDVNSRCKRKRKPKAGLLITGDPPTVFELWFRSGKPVVFIDTLNYYKQSLKSIGSELGVQKGTMPDWDAPDEDWFDYCRQDVVVLRAMVLHWLTSIERYNLGDFAYTLPGQAHHAWRHRFMTHPVVTHSYAHIQRLEHKALYGGQTECYFTGDLDKGLYHECDISALYPYVCAHNDLPACLDYQGKDGWQYDFDGKSLENAIAMVYLDTSDVAFPVHRKHRTGYVVGRYLTTLAGPELSYAHRVGAIHHFHYLVRYHMAPVFRDYMTYCWEQRLQCEKEGRYCDAKVWKMLLNSLWGKFTQRKIDWIDCPTRVPPQPWFKWYEISPKTGVLTTWRSVGTMSQYLHKEGFAKHSFVAIGAFVTSLARQHMRKVRECAGDRHVFHQAVDSVVVDDIGLENLKTCGMVGNREWGKLRVVRSGDNLRVYGVNVWALADKFVRASVKPRAREIDNWVFEESKFERLAGMISRAPDGTVKEQIVTLHLTPNTGMRIPTEDGWTRPLVLDEPCPICQPGSSGADSGVAM